MPIQPLSENNWRVELSKISIPISVRNDPLLLDSLGTLIDGGRISMEIGADLHRNAKLPGLTALARMIKHSRFGERIFFNENLHVNTTNVCTLACRFCAFRKGSRHTEAYSLNAEDFITRIEPYHGVIDEVHAVGGLHPDWTIDNYSEMYELTKRNFPDISIKSLTAVEVKHIASRSKLSIRQTLQILKESGLDSLPGGGAEILVDSIRNRICMGKEKSSEYLEIHEIAHELGIPTNCTMLFGTIESIEDRMTHLDKLRSQQDSSGGFQCFVPYPFLEDNTRLPEASLASGEEVIRVIALSRIMLDNIPHIKAYRMNIGDHLASIAINSGADDIDGTVGHEEIMHIAGSTASVDYDSAKLARLINSAGQEPVKRDSTYTKFEPIISEPISDWQILPIIGQ
ncbi:MAG TPA: CofH family radical SAM protein [Candidatus Poseidoniales archaeon]|jgi:aminodeoxyfutalosine synthase|nr:MAG: aminofutalosine synthase MqnE [Euryarchaeota archaeon]HIG34314.1 CofH family radical SAM protein [Candidatus Poseidoniales archaeon]HIL67758.1 CofH family radical SAM protein [Candidatus Poseidoniales archaeon]